MNKSRAARVAGFIGALGASAALVGAAVNTTGAYFTDTKTGSINSSTGTVKVDTTNTTLNFQGLLPGEFKTERVDYQATGSGKQDLWFVLPANSKLSTAEGTAYGRYAHFRLTSTAGANFVSNNTRAGSSPCATDPATGWGGSEQQATSTDNADNGSYVPYCPVPTAILIQANMNPGDSGYFNLEFGWNKILKSNAGSPLGEVSPYKIVATQSGVRPNDVNNPAN